MLKKSTIAAFPVITAAFMMVVAVSYIPSAALAETSATFVVFSGPLHASLDRNCVTRGSADPGDANRSNPVHGG